MAYHLSWVIQSQTIVILFNPQLGGDKEVDTFSNDIRPKVNMTVQLKFELAYNNVARQRVSYYATDILLFIWCIHAFLEQYALNISIWTS